MPSLRELQDAVRRAIVERDDLDAVASIVASGIAPQGRLSVYRNTFASTLIRALRLSYPAVDRLVGAAFFDGAALDHRRAGYRGRIRRVPDWRLEDYPDPGRFAAQGVTVCVARAAHLHVVQCRRHRARAPYYFATKTSVSV